MRILLQVSVLALLAAAVSSCKDKPPEPPPLNEAMPDLPLPPLATVVSRAGSEDALQITFRTPLVPDSIAAYYRAILSTGVWSLVSDSRTADGAIALYAERNGPPLWVTIRKDSTSSGTILSLGGAVTRPKMDSVPASPDSTSTAQ